VNAPAPKETTLHKRLRQLGEYAKQLETDADSCLMDALTYTRAGAECLNDEAFAHGKGVRYAPDALKVAAHQRWANIYRRRAKLARRDEKRLAAVVAFQDEQERRAEGRRALVE
jgi:hypothetical protein